MYQELKKTQRKMRKRNRKNNKVRRQQLSLWNQGKIKEKLIYKAKLKGIEVEETEESYTSQDCPFCGGRHQANGTKFYMFCSQNRNPS